MQIAMEVIEAWCYVHDLPGTCGGDPVDYACGQCGHILAERVAHDSVSHLVFECPKCDRLNRACAA